MKKRELWIDWSKMIGIFLVVLGHYNLENREWFTFIYSFHMPLFFIMSGYLFTPPCFVYENAKRGDKSLKFVDFINKNIKSLIFPYLIYCFISIIWVFFLHIVNGGELPDDYFIKSIYGIILGVGFRICFGMIKLFIFTC